MLLYEIPDPPLTASPRALTETSEGPLSQSKGAESSHETQGKPVCFHPAAQLQPFGGVGGFRVSWGGLKTPPAPAPQGKDI